MVSKKRGRSDEGRNTDAPKSKRSRSRKHAGKELGRETRESRSVSLTGDGSEIRQSETQPATPKPKIKRKRKRASGSARQLVADLDSPSHQPSSIGKHGPLMVRKSIGGIASNDRPRGQSPESVQKPVDVTPSKKSKVLASAGNNFESAKQEPKKKKPRRKPEAHVKSTDADVDPIETHHGVSLNELAVGSDRPDGPDYSGDQNEVINTTERSDSDIPALSVLEHTTDPKESKPIIRRPRKYQPWNVNKHISSSRDLLKEARSIGLDPKLSQILRQRLNLQKDTKAAFAEVIKDMDYSWSPPTPCEPAISNATCDAVVDLAYRSNISSGARKSLLDSLEGYKKVLLAIHEGGTEALEPVKLVQPGIDELLSAANTIIGHVNLAQETLKNSIQQGRDIKVKHIHDGRWELHSKDYIKSWAKVADAPDWEVPTLLFQRNDCQLENGELKHRCYVAGLLIGGEEYETHCLQIPKHASLEPIVAPTQVGRYVEGEEDTCHIDMTFLGHGCMELQIPKRLLDRVVVGKRGPKSKAIVHFYGVQIAYDRA